jgi:hypothetical protein
MKPSEIAKRDLAEWESYSEAEREEMRRYIPEADDFPTLCHAHLRLRERVEVADRILAKALTDRPLLGRDKITQRVQSAMDVLADALEESDDS